MNKFTDKMLSDLFAKYKQESSTLAANDNIELELRFRNITYEAFKDVYNNINVHKDFVNPQLECSINAISKNVFERGVGGKVDDSQYIRKIIFDRNGAAINSYVRKTRLSPPIQINEYIKYSVGLSRETEFKKFNTNMDALVRFKARVSFEHINGAWRFDLTAIKHGNLNELTNIKTIRDKLFTSKLTAANFLTEIDFTLIDGYEIEIEHIDKNKSLTIGDLAVAKYIFTMINPGYIEEIAYQDEIHHVAQYILSNQNIVPLFKQNTHRLKQLSNQVIALTKSVYYTDVYPPIGYYVTDKADGQRAVISINGPKCRILMSNKMMEFILPEESSGVTICDAELIWNSQLQFPPKEDTDHFTLHIFDVMVARDENISKTGFTNRSKYLMDTAKQVNSFVGTAGHTAQIKGYTRLSEENLEGDFREVFESDYPYKNEGLILTQPDEPYESTINYKWKIYEETTIDFLAIKCPQKLLGIKPYEVKTGLDLYLLFVGIDQQLSEKLSLTLIPYYKSIFPETGKYVPIQFSPSIAPYAYIYYHDAAHNIDHQIVELSRNKENTEWIFHRVRDDRKLEKNYFGNDYRIAELTFNNYIDPFLFEDLWKTPSSYFTKKANIAYKAPNAFKRFVISGLLKDNLSNARWVIDEASGRGADLRRYLEIGVENALFMDIDSTAISELIMRKFEIISSRKRHIKNWSHRNDTKITTKNLNVHVLVADLKTDHKDLVVDIMKYGVNENTCDGIVCNFALHYLCDTVDNIRNILLLNAKMLKVGGVFIFTVMDGQKVFNLLKPLSYGQTWELRDKNNVKYAIRKDYRADKITPCGQTISVLLPFSDKMYSEPLCNIEYIVREAKKMGFEMELNYSMGRHMENFQRANNQLYLELTDDDKTYINLHTYISLRKVKDIKKYGEV